MQLVPETEDEVSASNPNPNPNPHPNPNPSPNPSPSPNPNPNPNEVSAVCGAVSLLGWHQENAFSGVDGSRTEIADGGSSASNPKPEARARARKAFRSRSRTRSLSPSLAYTRREQAPARWPLAAPTSRPGGYRAG